MPYAKKGCSKCRYSTLGPGLLRVVNKDRNARYEVCSCAFNRFRKAHPNLVYDGTTGQWYWP